MGDTKIDLSTVKPMVVPIEKLVDNAKIPVYAKMGDAGMDLTATSVEIDKYGNVSYGIGLAMAIPFGYAGFIFPRSSISKTTLDLANSVGVIDSGYRGEIICKFKPTDEAFTSELMDSKSIRINYLRRTPMTIYEVGDRVAQIIIIPIPQILFKEFDYLDDTERGKGGFGSSGK